MSKDVLLKIRMLKGEAGGTIERIERVAIQGANDVMRMYLSDGSTVDFEVQNTLDDDHVKSIIAEMTDGALSDQSENAVQNKIITDEIVSIKSDVTQLQTDVAAKVGGWTYITHSTAPALSDIQPITIPDAVYSSAREFLAVFAFQASSAHVPAVEFVMPNYGGTSQHSPFPDARKNDYIGGYYYDDSYHATIYVRFNTNTKQVALHTQYIEVNGETDPDNIVGGTFALYYR